MRSRHSPPPAAENHPPWAMSGDAPAPITRSRYVANDLTAGLAGRRGVCVENVEGRRDQPRQGLEVVAPFEHRGDVRREGGASARELSEAVVADVHLDEVDVLVLVGVEPGGHEHELWAESRHSGLDALLERLQPFGVAASRG